MSYDEDTKAEMLDDLVEWISAGMTLRAFAREHDVGSQTLYRWVRELGYTERIARAREEGYEEIAEEALEIADDATNDYVDRWNEKRQMTERVLDAEHVQRSKLRIHTRLQLLAKWSPQRYGDKQHVTHANDPNQPITIVTGVPQPRAAAEDDVDISMFE